MDPSNESKNNRSLQPVRENQSMDSIDFGNGFNNKPKINYIYIAQDKFVFACQVVSKFSKIEFRKSLPSFTLYNFSIKCRQ